MGAQHQHRFSSLVVTNRVPPYVKCSCGATQPWKPQTALVVSEEEADQREATLVAA